MTNSAQPAIAAARGSEHNSMTFLQPEWARHERVWIGFPAIREEWGDAFEAARAEIADFARAIADGGAGEIVHLVCNSASDARIAEDLAGGFVNVIVEPIGDVWLRDTGPIITGTGPGRRAADFRFNYWGGKYHMPGDEDVGERLAARFGFARDAHEWVVEGGGIDWDGAGRVVTTEQCLLNTNRNPYMSRLDIERGLRGAIGAYDILWLGDGLLGDHTDGHVDNLARFVGARRLLLPVASGNDDPNAAIYADAHHRAAAWDVEIVSIPSPGRVITGGETVPASYMNFYIGNTVVAMPAYGTSWDGEAAAVLATCFPERRIVPLPSRAILSGGGSFHCTSQQVPV